MNLRSLTNVLLPHTNLPSIPGIPLGGSPSGAAAKLLTKGGADSSAINQAKAQLFNADGVEAQRTSARDIFQQLERPPLARCPQDITTSLHDLNKGVALAELVNEGGFRKLPKDVQARMLQEAVDGSEALIERFTRLAGDKRFAKLPEETQEKAVALLAKTSGDKAGSAAIEKLLKLESFAKLSPEDQAEILDVLGSKEGRGALDEVLSSQAFD